MYCRFRVEARDLGLLKNGMGCLRRKRIPFLRGIQIDNYLVRLQKNDQKN